MQKLFDLLDPIFWLAFSGGLGALIFTLNSDEGVKPLAFVVTIFTGAAVAVYGVPLAMAYFKFEDIQIALGVAFFTGVAARSIIKQVSRFNVGDVFKRKG